MRDKLYYPPFKTIRLREAYKKQYVRNGSVLDPDWNALKRTPKRSAPEGASDDKKIADQPSTTAHNETAPTIGLAVRKKRYSSWGYR